jgi:hypothetical protein
MKLLKLIFNLLIDIIVPILMLISIVYYAVLIILDNQLTNNQLALLIINSLYLLNRKPEK